MIQLNCPIQIETNKKKVSLHRCRSELYFLPSDLKKKRNTPSILDTNENDRRIKLDMSPAVEKICVALDELLSLRDEGIGVLKKNSLVPFLGGSKWKFLYFLRTWTQFNYFFSLK